MNVVSIYGVLIQFIIAFTPESVSRLVIFAIVLVVFCQLKIIRDNQTFPKSPKNGLKMTSTADGYRHSLEIQCGAKCCAITVCQFPIQNWESLFGWTWVTLLVMYHPSVKPNMPNMPTVIIGADHPHSVFYFSFFLPLLTLFICSSKTGIIASISFSSFVGKIIFLLLLFNSTAIWREWKSMQYLRAPSIRFF